MDKPYNVLKTTEAIRPRDEGGVEKYYRVMIKTKGGAVLTIDISEDDFTAEKAGPILLEKAKEADKILKL